MSTLPHPGITHAECKEELKHIHVTITLIIFLFQKKLSCFKSGTIYNQTIVILLKLLYRVILLE